VWIDARARLAHEKALIIDRRVTIMGSYNFSAGAARNSEDLNGSRRPRSPRHMRGTGKRG
jgi:PLD-like domain